MKVKRGRVACLLLAGLFWGLAVSACSSSTEQQQEAVENQDSQAAPQEEESNGQVSNNSDQTQTGQEQSSEGVAENATAESNPAASADEGLAGLINDMNSNQGPTSNGSAPDNSAASNQPETATNSAPIMDMDSAPAIDPSEMDTASSALSSTNSQTPTTPVSSSSASAPATATASATASPAELPEMGAKLAYVVEKGDTLGKISQKIFGQQNQWKHLAKISGISDPNKIYPGEVVYYQLSQESLAFASVYEATPKSSVTVAAGDTLAKISQKIFGTTHNWRAIWRQNDQVNDPEVLPAGSVVFYLNQKNLVSQVESLRLKLQKQAEVRSLKNGLTQFKTNMKSSSKFANDQKMTNVLAVNG